MRIRIGIVAETDEAFTNQVKLCLFSLRMNGGALRNVPVTLITNSESLESRQEDELRQRFHPIEFKIAPRLGAIPHTSKLNVFYSIDPSSYDLLIYLDCDTVIRGPLDGMVSAVEQGFQFVCRRGGETDRDRFFDFDALVARFCGSTCQNKLKFAGHWEWPMFNTGVFLATNEAVRRIRKDSIEFTYRLFNEWQRIDARENFFPMIRILSKLLYRFHLLRKIHRSRILTSQDVLETWVFEQGAVALACIKSGVKVTYLDETYNSWGGDEDFKILHCFKSLYKFDRQSMFDKDSEKWLEGYLNSGIPGQIFLAQTVREYKNQVIAYDRSGSSNTKGQAIE